MSDPRMLSQDQIEILLARELRRAGLELPRFHVRRREPLAEEVGRYELLFEAVLRTPQGDDRVLIDCQNRNEPIPSALVRALSEMVAASELEKGMMVATTEYETDAVALGAELGIVLLRVVDGTTAWRQSAWAGSGRPPAWFPEFTTQLLTPGVAGGVRAEALPANHPQAIVGRLRVQRKTET